VIKAIITDVDGVAIGEKIGYNSPSPHSDVLEAMKQIHSKGIPIALCTAKPHYAIGDIIKGANLTNPHITDAGAVIIDPIDDIIIEKHPLPKDLAKKILGILIENNVYTEFYTVEGYYTQKDRVSDITKKHIHILQKDPVIVSSLTEESIKQDITKIMPVAFNIKDKKRVDQILKEFFLTTSIGWSVHPVALPLQFGIITAKGSSKKEGAEAISNNIHVPFDNILGIGDSTSDWQFIQLCGYVGIMENASGELKELAKSKGEGKYYIGGHVNENGILNIFKHFSLI
jgi:HAD superfamily hydrolase (TIGR01484 family)